MEIKAQIINPTETQRVDFIVEQNHKLGYEIKEYSTVEEQQGEFVNEETGKEETYTNEIITKHLEAWGYTEEEIEEQKREQFLKDFFNTSLGYVRRSVSMKNGETKSFLTDILPLLQVGVPILTYTIEGEQNKVLVTEEFLQECKAQVIADFYGVENEGV